MRKTYNFHVSQMLWGDEIRKVSDVNWETENQNTKHETMEKFGENLVLHPKVD